MRAEIEVSSARAERELGVSFRPLEETIRDVVAWYRAEPRFAPAQADVARATASAPAV